MSAAPSPKDTAPLFEERSVEDLLALLEQMVSNCADMVASLARASAVLKRTKPACEISNSNSD